MKKKKVDLTQIEAILIPYNFEKSHWNLIIIHNYKQFFADVLHFIKEKDSGKVFENPKL